MVEPAPEIARVRRGAGVRTASRVAGLWMAVCLLALCLAPIPATAQGHAEAGWLVGRVVEAGTGDPVVGAEVRLAQGSRWTVTDESGRWRLGPLAQGRHTVRIHHVGYATSAVALELPHVAGRTTRIEVTPRPVLLNALVVTAGRRAQRLADTPVPTELVTRQEIRQTGAADLASVLTEQTGVTLQGGHPAGAGVMLQGMGSERVLVLLDGQPYIGRISGQVDVSRLPTSMIQRVEVVKGPQSTLYGSEAMGGVINVITRRPGLADGWTAGGSIVAGGQGRLDLSGNLAGALGPVALRGDAGRRVVELVPGQAGQQGARAERWDGMAKARWTSPDDALTLSGSAMLLDERQRWQNGQLFHFADNLQWAARVGAEWRLDEHRLAPTLYVTRFDHLSRRATAPTPVEGTGERESQRLAEAELLYGFDGGSYAIDAGLELRREAVKSDRVEGGRRDDTTLESFAQTTLSLGGVSVVPGVRATWSESWGTHLTPRVATLYRPVPSVALRASFGEGFRAPEFKELHMEFLNVGPGFGYVVRGNPELSPEVSRNLTASVEWTGQQLYARIQAFDNRFDDFIETRALGDSAGLTVYTYGNVDDGFTRGAELELGATFGAWRVQGGYSLLRAERADTGEPLLGRPRSSARATLGWAHPWGLRTSVTGVYTGRTAMARTPDGTQWREGFLRFDARVAHELPGGLELVVGVDNMLDQTVPEWPGFAGRHLYAGVSYEL